MSIAGIGLICRLWDVSILFCSLKRPKKDAARKLSMALSWSVVFAQESQRKQRRVDTHGNLRAMNIHFLTPPTSYLPLNCSSGYYDCTRLLFLLLAIPASTLDSTARFTLSGWVVPRRTLEAGGRQGASSTQDYWNFLIRSQESNKSALFGMFPIPEEKAKRQDGSEGRDLLCRTGGAREHFYFHKSLGFRQQCHLGRKERDDTFADALVDCGSIDSCDTRRYDDLPSRHKITCPLEGLRSVRTPCWNICFPLLTPLFTKSRAECLAEKERIGQTNTRPHPVSLFASHQGNFSVVCAVIVSLWHCLERHMNVKIKLGFYFSCRIVFARTGAWHSFIFWWDFSLNFSSTANSIEIITRRNGFPLSSKILWWHDRLLGMTVLGANVHKRTEYIVQSTFALFPDPDHFLGSTVRRQRKGGSRPQIEGRWSWLRQARLKSFSWVQRSLMHVQSALASWPCLTTTPVFETRTWDSRAIMLLLQTLESTNDDQ